MPLSTPPAFKPFVPPITLGALGTVLTSNGLTAATPPTFQALPTAASGANPTASIALAAVNGVATTFMRSDAAPPLDQTISPTMTGVWTFSSAEPRLLLNETDQGANLKLWDFDVSAGVMAWRTRTDADGAGVNVIAATRGVTTAITDVSFGNATNNPTYTFLGTNTVSATQLSISGLATAGRLNVTSSTTTTVGINRPGANRLGFLSNTTLVGEFDATGQFKVSVVGRGVSVPEGANAKMGTAVLVGGTIVVATTAVTANSRILLTAQVLGTVAVASALAVTARTAGTSFTITAAVATDTSTIAWILFEPS